MTRSLASDFIAALASGDLETTLTRKPWGGEASVEVPGVALIKVITYVEGERTSLQVHEHKEEILIPLVQEGEVPGTVEINGEVFGVEDAPFHILPGDVHRVTGPMNAIEISTYFPDDVVRLEDDYGRAEG